MEYYLFEIAIAVHDGCGYQVEVRTQFIVRGLTTRTTEEVHTIWLKTNQDNAWRLAGILKEVQPHMFTFTRGLSYEGQLVENSLKKFDGKRPPRIPG